MATSDVGPHYCPADSTIYLDETFFDELQTRFHAKGGDAAEAYVIAHEVGHHIQQQAHTLNSVPGANNGTEANAMSVDIELQADCFAGVWANSVSKEGVVQPGEINEAIDAAAAEGSTGLKRKRRAR